MGDLLDNCIGEIQANQPSPKKKIVKELEEEYRKMRGFAIRKIVVYKVCDKGIRKILDPGEYVFTEPSHDHFFLDGVTVSTVVGKNGSGKSSLIELMFRLINNLGAMMLRNFDRPAAEELYFIDKVVADLYFVIDGKEGCLQCDQEKVVLTHDGYYFEWRINDGSCTYRINDKIQHEADYQVAVRVARNFFYTIVTNYCLQAYISDDYKGETTYRWQQKKDRGGNLIEGYEWRTEQAGVWIDSIFHKNDGYMCPIVLNPYRVGGKVDMEKEGRLTVNRLCSLLLQSEADNYEIIDGYRLETIEYSFNQGFLLEKFSREVLRNIPTERVSDKFLYAYLLDNSYAKAILDGYGVDATKAMNYIELTLRMYLVYKTFSIASKYPQYGHFKPIGDVNNAFKQNKNKYELNLAKELAELIKDRHSHIELKVHQTLDLIKLLDHAANKDLFDRPLTYDTYNQLLGKSPKCATVAERMDTLPPPLFKPHIKLKKVNECEVVELSDLSSGQRQFIYTTSTLLYHLINLQSIPGDERLAYQNVCLVLDEMEICFHPELQRKFVSKLLSLLQRNHLNTTFKINIILVTHSPFVLSDIPKGNILYLEDGANVTGDKKLNTFGANVNELLNQSFFLSGGFMGEFAKQKIESLVDYLTGDRQDEEWNADTARELIDIVGDEVIKYQLQQLYAKKYKDTSQYREWIEREARKMGIIG